MKEEVVCLFTATLLRDILPCQCLTLIRTLTVENQESNMEVINLQHDQLPYSCNIYQSENDKNCLSSYGSYLAVRLV